MDTGESQVTITLDGGRRERLATRAAEAGYEDLGQFIGSLVDRELYEADIDAMDGPLHLTFRSKAELEQLLLQRVTDPRPTIPMTPQFWDDIRRRAGLPVKTESRP
jgi:hypothetical protein